MHAMLYDPEDAATFVPIDVSDGFAFPYLNKVSHPKCRLTGLNHFSPKAYGLHDPCLRLATHVTARHSRLGSACAGSALREQHSQLQG